MSSHPRATGTSLSSFSLSRSIKLKSALAGGLLLLAASSSQAAPVTIGAPQPGLAGTTDFDGWHTLTAAAVNPAVSPATYPGFPGSGAWPAPIASQTGGNALLNKVANGAGGGPYPASGSIYYGGFSGDPNIDGGKLSVTDTTPLAGIANIVFQIQIGEAATHDFYNDVLPTLKYNGTTAAGTPTTKVIEKYFNGTVTMPTGEEPLYINTYLMQWDVSSLGPITDFTIDWNGVQHAQVYALRLDQSTAFSSVNVPEPGAAGLLSLAAVPLLKRRRTAKGEESVADDVSPAFA